jgi:hypothetical protein
MNVADFAAKLTAMLIHDASLTKKQPSTVSVDITPSGHKLVSTDHTGRRFAVCFVKPKQGTIHMPRTFDRPEAKPIGNLAEGVIPNRLAWAHCAATVLAKSAAVAKIAT